MIWMGCTIQGIFMLCVVSVVITIVIGVDIRAHNNYVIIDGFTFSCYSLFFLPPPTLHSLDWDLTLYLVKLFVCPFNICFLINMIPWLHLYYTKHFWNLVVLGALQWLSLKKRTIVTNDLFHHFCHLHINYKVLVMMEKKCWPNNVCTRAWHSKTLIYATWMNTKPSMLLILCFLHFVPTQGLVAFIM